MQVPGLSHQKDTEWLRPRGRSALDSKYVASDESASPALSFAGYTSGQLNNPERDIVAKTSSYGYRPAAIRPANLGADRMEHFQLLREVSERGHFGLRNPCEYEDRDNGNFGPQLSSEELEQTTRISFEP
ncbi:hypothetical protein VTO73DRAFT_11625 [Trametes versicolor]